MKTLLKNGNVINVFTGEIEVTDVLINESKIIGVGSYDDSNADTVIDVKGKTICPSFIDGHIHIESTMLTPAELTKVSVSHGTGAIIADPHEIANVCGTDGIQYMIDMSKDLPMDIFFMLPSCVPATPFDESAGVLNAENLEPLYKERRVLGLAEMMNYPGLLSKDQEIRLKIADCYSNRCVADGHAPFLTGHDLDVYTSYGISSDHECSTPEEAIEKLKKGQWIMIRQGTAARNLEALLPLFEEPYWHRCLLATDDRHPDDLLHEGHIDNIVRLAIKHGKSPVRAIQMATINACNYFGIRRKGAIAPGFDADLLILDNLEKVEIETVFFKGRVVCEAGNVKEFERPVADKKLTEKVMNSFHLSPLTAKDFTLDPAGRKIRVIEVIPGELITNELIVDELDPSINKLAVIERHNNTGHKGIGYIKGINLRSGAIASSVSHDSHNLIVIGATDSDMAIAANEIIKMGGGNVVVNNGKVIAKMALPIAGLMTTVDAATAAKENKEVHKAVYGLGVPAEIEPFMNMAFVSLPVIPSLKMSTQGLIDVNAFAPVSVFIPEKQ